MRSDQTQSAASFRRAAEWSQDPFTHQSRPAIDSRYTVGTEDTDKTRWHSFSGHERNSFFLNRHGQTFENASSLSGLDNIADSRVWVRWDYDHDGQVDIAMVNADYPLLNLYHNQVTHSTADGSRVATPRHFLALRLHGAQRSNTPNRELSNRDAYGARIIVQLGDRSLLRAHTCGEGFAGQNSATELIGLGEAAVVERLTIHWPSGKSTQLDHVAVDQRIDAYETADTAPHGELFQQAPYQKATPGAALVAQGNTRVNSREQPRSLRLNLASLLGDASLADSTELLCFTTTATWCEACHRLQPRLHKTVDRLHNRVQFLGIPIDPIETTEELDAFAATHRPAYTVLSRLGTAGREQVVLAIEKLLDTQSIPCTLVTDREGRVLEAFLGVPNTSDLGRLLKRSR